MKRSFIITIALGISSIIFLSGCSFFQSKDERTAPELASEGMEAYRKEKYKSSIEAFEKLKNWYPFSKYAILAELKKSDAHYHLKEYEEAIFGYEDFENLHPRNEAIPYVIYQIGRSYFDQIDTMDRDQETAKKAIETFSRLVKQFPKDAYSNKAKTHIKKSQKSLAQHDLYVGMFYFRGKHYPAAISRFKLILNNYPDVGVHQEAIRYLVKSEALMMEK